MKLLTFLKNLWLAFWKTPNYETKMYVDEVGSKAMPVNYGVDGVPTIRPTDWIRGKESGIVENVRNIYGDWTGWAPPGEWQRDMRTLFESEACMGFSELDSLESQIAFMIKMNTISDDNIKWLRDNGYVDANGKVNFSDRFTAKMSGTTKSGNNFQNVWGSARSDGLVPESAWPFPFDELKMAPAVSGETQENWDIYYAEIPQSVKDLGQEFRKRFTIQYEWVNTSTDESMQSALKMAPLHIATAVCMPWNTTSIIPGCGPGWAHATTLLKIDDTCRYILDHYLPFLKRFAKDYVITYAVRGVIVEKVEPTAPARFSHVFTKSFKLGDTDPELILVQNILKIGGYFPLTVNSTGYYGSITAGAVKKLQDAYGIAPDAPNNIGPRTIALLNSIVAAQ